MYELKKIGKVFTSNLLGPGPRLLKKSIYRAAVSQRLRNTDLDRAGIRTCYVTSFGATKLPAHPEDEDEVISRNVWKSSHPDAVVCPRKLNRIL